MQTITKARIAGWGQFILECFNEALNTNGGSIPNTKAAWLRLGSSLVLAIGVHLASATSAGHPNAANTTTEQSAPLVK